MKMRILIVNVLFIDDLQNIKIDRNIMCFVGE